MRNAVISRDEILEASRLMLQEKGWSAIHMRSVAVRCGVSVGSLYNYFPSKTELVAATVESVCVPASTSQWMAKRSSNQ